MPNVPRQQPVTVVSWKRVWLLTAVTAILAPFVYRDFGVTFDEGAQAEYGDLALQYYRTAGADDRVNNFYNLRYYGPAVEMAASLVAGGGSNRRFEARHLLLALIATLSIPAIAAFAGHAGRRGVPLIAATILLTMPRFTGHAFNNSKDVPFALAFILFMATLAAVLIDSNYSWRRILAAGAAFGFALSIRPGGLLLLGVFFICISRIIEVVPAMRGRERPLESAEATTRSHRKLAILGIAWLSMFLLWPYAHARPLLSLAESTALALSLPRPIPVLFEGQIVSSAAIPWYYLPKMLIITTPLTVLAMAALGATTGLRSVFRKDGDARFGVVALLTTMWLVVPIALFIVRRPAVYDGIRHFLFLLPALAILAALGATTFGAAIANRFGRPVAGAIVAVLVLLPVKDVVRLHPYQMTYYNGLVGGVAGAAPAYDTDYWLSGYREAMTWIGEETADEPERTVNVLMAGFPIPSPEDLADGPECWTDRRPPAEQVLVTDFLKTVATHAAARNVRVHTLPELWETGRDAAEMDFYVATTRWGYDRCLPDAPIVHSVGRAGATFVVVKATLPDASLGIP